jgi:hypothetical protein
MNIVEIGVGDRFGWFAFERGDCIGNGGGKFVGIRR